MNFSWKKTLTLLPPILTVVGAIVIATVSWFYTITDTQLLQAVVALLALIGTTLITERLIEVRSIKSEIQKNRSVFEEYIEESLEGKSKNFDQTVIRRRDLEPLEDRLHGAKKVSILGGSLFRLTNEYKKVFEDLLREGCQLRFLMVDPASTALDVLGTVVVYEISDIDTYRSHSKASFGVLAELIKQYPKQCSVRFCDYPPSFSMVQIQKADSDAVVQLEMYPINVPARDRPTFIFDVSKEPKLYGFYADQFDKAWQEPYSKDAVG